MKGLAPLFSCLLLCAACAPVGTAPSAAPALPAVSVTPPEPAVPASPAATIPAPATVPDTAAIAAAPEPADSPSRVHASYMVYKGSIEIAQIEEIFTRTDNRYTLSSTARPLGLLALFKPGAIHINSSGSIGPRGLQPQSFSYRREGDDSKTSRAEFDWRAKRLSLANQAQRTELALPKGTQDRLSAMYQFMFLSLRPASSVDFPMTNGSKLDNYHYAVKAGQQISTPAGVFSTLYLDSQAQAGESRTEIWLAEQFRNLPCKMIITDADGGHLTQLLTRLDIKP